MKEYKKQNEPIFCDSFNIQYTISNIKLEKRTQFPPFFSKFQGSKNLYTCIPAYLFSQNKPIFHGDFTIICPK